MKTYVAKPTDRERNWLVVDAEGQTLGRLATQLADALRGKRKPTYTPHIDTGDFVVVVNAEKIAVTGSKRTDKMYYRHSGYPAGSKSRTLNDMLERRPEEVIRLAVKGMLPRTRLGRKQLTKLKIYAGPEHPHTAQQPQPMGADREEVGEMAESNDNVNEQPEPPEDVTSEDVAGAQETPSAEQPETEPAVVDEPVAASEPAVTASSGEDELEYIEEDETRRA